MSRIFAIVGIWLMSTLAWTILGATLFARTDSPRARDLHRRVGSTWGTEQTQAPLTATAFTIRTTTETVVDSGRTTERSRVISVPTPLERTGTDLKVNLDLEHRQKGLRWFSTYRVALDGRWRFHNAESEARSVELRMPFPAAQAMYDDVHLRVNGREVPGTNQGNALVATVEVPAGGDLDVRAGYRSQGLDRWRYDFGSDVHQVRDFSLVMRTNFEGIDFPDNTLSPTARKRVGPGWELAWKYANLVSGYSIGMEMPAHLQPGPLAGTISFFAPVSLFFFFFLVFMITTLRGEPLHPMNYFFLAAGFFAFHLLLAYLVDHVDLHVAFATAAVVSMLLVISYLRLVSGLRFALVEAGIAQFVYLVLFSYAFFFQGYTGLAVTIASVITLFVVMQMTGRVRWEDHFAPTRPTGSLGTSPGGSGPVAGGFAGHSVR